MNQLRILGLSSHLHLLCGLRKFKSANLTGSAFQGVNLYGVLVPLLLLLISLNHRIFFVNHTVIFFEDRPE